MRLFVALEIPAEVRNELESVSLTVRPNLPQMRWVAKENIHLTLKFVGEMSLEQFELFRSLLSGVHLNKDIELYCAGLGIFNKPKAPGVIFAKIEPSTELLDLAVNIKETGKTMVLLAENRALVPHLTLARCKAGEMPKNIGEILRPYEDRKFGTWRTREFHLIESKLKPSGSEYTILQSFPFLAET